MLPTQKKNPNIFNVIFYLQPNLAKTYCGRSSSHLPHKIRFFFLLLVTHFSIDQPRQFSFSYNHFPKLILYVLCPTCEVGQDFTCEFPSTSSYPRFFLIKQNLHQTRGAPCHLFTFECYFMTSKLCLFRVDTFIYYTHDLYCKKKKTYLRFKKI